MKLYNALSQSIENFTPGNDAVSIYVCGITPYDTTHLGHAFTYTTFDVLIRFLEYKQHSVTYVQNVTDIDDDILRKAKAVNDDWLAVGNRWTRHFIEDLQTLNLRPPDYFPRATEVIAPMIDIIERLLDKGAAYEAGGSVYFYVDAWPEFGQLSRIPKEEMLAVANERGNNPNDPHKQDPLDFVLWQAHAPGEPAWDSPWGPGRPGWHIECSTMAAGLLGNTIDIHGGGSDLIFPHHESEIAQSEAATGEKPFVRFWLHTAMVHHEGEKMSKSLGNLVMARDLLQTWSPDAIRLYLAAHHYRDIWSHSDDELALAEQLAQQLRAAAGASGGDGATFDASTAEAAVIGALDYDLDTPAALVALEKLAGDIITAAAAGQDSGPAQAALIRLSTIFGLRLDAAGPEDRVIAGWHEHLKKF
ncbi:MAG: cysteine--tRNA ligase [Anaerolineaceae bacterium]|nr:cysteine--tRNA ligase [Anaerolineaceae bacterium]MCB9099554.1 cysteine--tRNA ligase [Anaerolineales bacterium]